MPDSGCILENYPEPKLAPTQLARWLALPLLFVACQWCLLVSPGSLLGVCPPLWTPASQTVLSLLPPTPTTKLQSFELGRQFAIFELNNCSNRSMELPAPCKEALSRAGEAVNRGPLKEKELMGERELIAQVDQHRSVMDRVMGFFTFVNVLCCVAIVGIVLTVGPCIAYAAGPCLRRFGTLALQRVIIPLGKLLHEWGIFELLAYAGALLLCVQGSRYPVEAIAGTMIALAGGLFFLPCWAYSTSMHTKGSGDKSKFLVVSNVLLAGVFAPLALVHASELIGFVAVLAVYGALGFVFLAFGFGFLVGFDSDDSMVRCVVASAVLIVVFSGLRIANLDPSYLKPFALGAMCLGNVMYFLGVLIMSSSWHQTKHNYWARQVLMVCSLVLAVCIGAVLVIPAMLNTACTFLVLYLMEKELEVQWGGMGIVVIFANFVAMFFASLWLNEHPGFIVSLFDPRGIYA